MMINAPVLAVRMLRSDVFYRRRLYDVTHFGLGLSSSLGHKVVGATSSRVTAF